MRYAGQKCTATSRVVVAREVEDSFLDQLRRQIDGLVLGPVTVPNAAVGPVITEQARDAIRRTLDASDAERVYEGKVPDTADFAEIHLKVDAIDPAADPNRRYPGPDGRIEIDAPATLPPPE